MSALLSLPREIRDEILRLCLLPEFIDISHRKEMDWVRRYERHRRDPVIPLDFMPSSLSDEDYCRPYYIQSNPSYMCRSKPTCPALMLVNWQLYAETTDAIRRFKELRSLEIDFELDTTRSNIIRTKRIFAPSYICFGSMERVVTNLRFDFPYRESEQDGSRRSRSSPTSIIMRLNILTAIMAVLKMRREMDSSVAGETIDHRFTIKDFTFNFVTPRTTNLSWFEIFFVPLGERYKITYKIIMKTPLVNIIGLVRELIIPVWSEFVWSELTAAPNELYGSIFSRVGRVAITIDGEEVKSDNGMPLSLCSIVLEGLKARVEPDRHYWRCVCRVDKAVLQRLERDLPVERELLKCLEGLVNRGLEYELYDSFMTHLPSVEHFD